MTKFQDRYNKLLQFREEREQGIYHGIPLWEEFPTLGKYIPSINKGQVIIDAASSGIGKSMIGRAKNVIAPWNFVRKHPECGIKLRFLIFLLEDDEERFIDYIITSLLGMVHNIHISPTELKSNNQNPISKEILQKVKSVEKYVEDILSMCTIITSTYNSYGIFKDSKRLSEDWGTHYYKYGEEESTEVINKVQFSKLKELPPVLKDLDKKELLDKGIILKEYQNFWRYSHYEPNDPDEQVIFMCDNINCLHPDKHEINLKTAMDNLAYNYVRMNMAKHWNWTCILIQQNVGGAEEQEFDFKGNSVIKKLEPSLDKLGDSKLTQRAAHLVYGLFGPSRYGINKYLGYDIKALDDNARFLFILKNNDGRANVIIPLWFYGPSGVFKELPLPNGVNQGYIEQMRKGII